MYIFIYIVYTHPYAVDSVGFLGPRKRSSNRDAERRIKKMWLTEKTENRVNFNNTTPNNKSMCILCRCVYNLHKVVMLFWMDDALLPSVVLHFFTFFILFFSLLVFLMWKQRQTAEMHPLAAKIYTNSRHTHKYAHWRMHTSTMYGQEERRTITLIIDVSKLNCALSSFKRH